MKSKKAIYNMTSNIIGKMCTIILGIILPKLYIESFGSEMNGLLSSISGLFVYINLLEAGVGTASTQALYKPLNENDQDQINSILSATHKFYNKTGIYCLACISIMAFMYPFFINSNIDYWVIVAIIMFTGSSSIIKFFLQGKYTILLMADNRAYILNNLNTVFNTSSSIIKIILILNGFNVIGIQLVFSLINLLQSIFVIVYVKINYRYLDLSRTPNVKAISQKKSVVIHQIASIILYNTDVLILSLFCDFKIVSVYTVYNMIFTQALFIPSTFSEGLTASLGQLYSENNMLNFERIYYFYEDIYLFLSFATLTVAYLLIIPFLTLYTNNIVDINYIDYIIAILFFIVSILTSIRTSNLLLINISGNFKTTQTDALIETIINLILSILLVQKYSIYGVLMATIIAVIYRTIKIISFVNFRILKRRYVKYVKKLFINIFITSLIIPFKELFINNVNGYLEFFVKGINVAIKIYLIYLIANFILNKSFRDTFKNIIKR